MSAKGERGVARNVEPLSVYALCRADAYDMCMPMIPTRHANPTAANCIGGYQIKRPTSLRASAMMSIESTLLMSLVLPPARGGK